MKKLIFLVLAAMFAATAFIGCNSDYTPGENTSSSTVVYSFALSKDDSVLRNLDTVFFSIDLDRARIYNADSLPYGTRINKLVPVIKMLETVTAATLTVHRANGTDTVYNYITNSTDTIDFSNGPVILDVTSPNGAVKHSYSIQVNVHQLKSDSLAWSNTAKRALPSSFTVPARQKTVRTAEGIYCLTSNGEAYSMAFAATPDTDNWEIYTTELPAGADMASLSASDDALFILADGTLYTSTDGARTWSNTGEQWSYIYGGYTTRAIGVKKVDGAHYFVDYPATVEPSLIPEDMPVADTSVPVAFSFPMSADVQTVMVGGTLANGTLCNAAWAYDGTQWAKLSTIPLPKALKGMSLVPFFTFMVNSAFIATKYSVLLAFGGNDGTSNNRTVYMSSNYGMTWAEGGVSLQLPDYIPDMAYSQAYVYNTELTSRSGSDLWQSFETACRIPGSAIFENGFSAASRGDEPINSWDCPYIYVFGGRSADGQTYNTIWRGTLNRLTFKPLQ